MADGNNGRASIREVYKEIIPMREDIAEIRTMLKSHLVICKETRNENKKEHRHFISRKLFTTISVILGLLIAIFETLSFIRG